MENTELIKALRSASTVSTAWRKLMCDAADALESIGKGIRECMRVLRRGGYSSSNGANSTFRHARSSTHADTNRCSGIEAAKRRTRIGSAS